MPINSITSMEREREWGEGRPNFLVAEHADKGSANHPYLNWQEQHTNNQTRPRRRKEGPQTCPTTYIEGIGTHNWQWLRV